MPSTIRARTLGWLATVILLTGCASTANVDYDPAYDFSALRTLAIEPSSAATPDDTRINSPLVMQRIDSEIRRQLESRGYRVVSDGADVTLRYRLGTRSGVEAYNSGVSIGYGRFSGRHAFGFGYDFPFYDVASYDDSVLTIDIHAADDRLLWRGSDSRRLGDGMTPEKLDRMVSELVGSTLANFPPQPGSSDRHDPR